jgi:hypothetical protein
MVETKVRYWKGGRGERMLWFGVFAGPAAWFLDLGFSYSLAQHVCSTGHEYLLHLITALCFVLALLGLLAAFVANREIPDQASHEGGSVLDRSRFLAYMGYIFSIGFGLTIIAGGVPRWVLPPCM